ncbi:MAG: hypothetical protein J6K74_05660 [Marinifilaceae bacterium]|nr:hypothetical protein [Marinifilaceae bacterium]
MKFTIANIIIGAYSIGMLACTPNENSEPILGNSPNEQYPQNILFSEYLLDETNCRWNVSSYDSEILCINDNKEFIKYILCEDTCNCPDIDFENNTLIIIHGGCPNAIRHIRMGNFLLMSDGNDYKFNVELILDKVDFPEYWIKAIVTEKLRTIDKIELEVNTSFYTM